MILGWERPRYCRYRRGALLQLAEAAGVPCPDDIIIIIMYELGAFLVNGRDRTRTDANGHERTVFIMSARQR